MSYIETHNRIEERMREWEARREHEQSLVSAYAENKCVGICTKVNEWGQYKCPNDLYVLVTKRYRLINEVVHTRKVVSVGIIFRRFGRSFDIPLTHWVADED